MNILQTNGRGGYSYQSIDSIPTHPYHSLYTIALNAPTNRFSYIESFEEIVFYDHEKFYLRDCIQSYFQDSYFEIHYQIKDLIIVKKSMFIHETDTYIISYHASKNIELFIIPYFSFHDHHHLSNNQDLKIETNQYLKVYDQSHSIYMNHPDLFINETKIIKRLINNEESYVTSLGYYFINSNQIEISISLKPESINFKEAFIHEEKRLKDLEIYEDEKLNQLIKISDSFIVKRDNINSYSMIAGYPWFTDWGRDTLISFEGNILIPKRYEIGKQILHTFLSTLKQGLTVNMFSDNNEVLYNTVDASLWLIHACFLYYKHTNDSKFYYQEAYKKMQEIIHYYIIGTKHAIYLDDDFLLHSGEKEDQVTWMDVRVNNKAITPRHGKCVEINALWYNALMIMHHTSTSKYEKDYYYLLADKCKESFISKFYYQDYLKDVVDQDDVSLRPNQLFACSLPYTMIDNQRMKSIYELCLNKLYIGRGLRSLDYRHKDYHGHYIGNQIERDLVYHQGTAWGFLIGPFLRTAYKLKIDHIESLLQPLLDTLDIENYHTLNEIFDGDAPYTLRGAFHQAWSISEVICILYLIKSN